jgi:hypothetical protein
VKILLKKRKCFWQILREKHAIFEAVQPFIVKRGAIRNTGGPEATTN